MKRWIKEYLESICIVGCIALLSHLMYLVLCGYFGLPSTSGNRLIINIAAMIVVIIVWICYQFREEIRMVWVVKRTYRKAKKNGDAIDIYQAIDRHWVSYERKNMPKRIFKYYSLEGDPQMDKTKMETLRENRIWLSLPSEFNDPFEGKYAYLTEHDIEEMGLPGASINLWTAVMNSIREYITITCFSQSPDSMPMWAYYGNNHRGFCVEYSIEENSNLYPVMYVNNRVRAKSMFVNLMYSLFNEQAPEIERYTTLKHLKFLCSFKHKSWSSEKEIRAIMLSRNRIKGKGELRTCKEVGVKVQKIYIGMACSDENELELKGIAEEMGVPYEKCDTTFSDTFSVLVK